MIFSEYFLKATKTHPFPYQVSLADADLSHLALAAPTGAGKTAAATLAWLWQLKNDPDKTPRRLVICLPMKTLVEQVYTEVTKWLDNLNLDRLKVYPLLGGYKDEGWELRPEDPAIIVGTQDQLLSRALNRGYAMSRFRWPIPFGLLHNDTQWVFDEIQLMGPGLISSAQLHGLRQKLGHYGSVGTLWMSATLNLEWLDTIDHGLGEGLNELKIHPFSLDDQNHPVMAARLFANKPISRLELEFDKSYAKNLSTQIVDLHKPGTFTLVIVNTVDRARDLHALLAKAKAKIPDPIYLLHSRFRPSDRQHVLREIIDAQGGKIVVSTQVVEAGVDISAHTLITELASWPSLIQRFGRANRKGEIEDAQIYWIDLPDAKAAPYEETDFHKSRKQLENLDSVEPAKFLSQVGDPLPSYDTLRKRDLLDLFNTTGDLCGLDIDVSRFIRDGTDRDVFVFWRDWNGDTPWYEIKAPSPIELCSVSKFKLVELIRKDKIKVWFLDDLRGKAGEWRRAKSQDIITGHAYLAHSSQGCYSPETGWDPSSKSYVLEAGEITNSPFPTMVSDLNSVSTYLTLEEHTNNVCDELNKVIGELKEILNDKAELLKTAARLHDLGKAHPVFQETMKDGCTSEIAALDALWAKKERTGRLFHSRRYFRHELVSALACLEMDYPFLICYIVAAHHGKARLSIRAFPDEVNAATLGIIEGDILPPVPFLDSPEIKLSLDPFKLGRGSWQDRALKLLDQLGPFKLAYLESLLRAADVRASIAEQKKGELINA